MQRPTPRIASALLAALALTAGLGACGSSDFDPKTSLGKQAILDSVSLALTQQDCRGAISTLKPIYNSIDTDNEVRMAMATAYACGAGINLFKFVGDIGTNSSAFAGGGFWAFLASEFPSTDADRIPEASQLAQDALQSIIDPGAIVLSNYLFNTATFNPAAYRVADRNAAANAYLFFVSMAGIGGFESRYGLPYPNGTKSVDLPWTTPTAVTADGCAFGSHVVNFADSLTALAEQTKGTLKTTITTLKSTFQTAIYTACDQACVLYGLPSCPTCPMALRDRTACTQVATDPSSVAVAGITTLINTPGLGWSTGP